MSMQLCLWNRFFFFDFKPYIMKRFRFNMENFWRTSIEEPLVSVANPM